jgi:hypothetical protein
VSRRAKLCVLAWLCTAGAAAAQPAKPDRRAEQHHQRGLRFLREEPKDFAAAAAEFAAAYEIDPRPRYMFNLALAQRLGGACRKAIDSYRAYLATSPPESYAADARTGIERCEKLLGAEGRPSATKLEPIPPDRSGSGELPPTGEPGPGPSPITPPPVAPQPGAGSSRGVALALHQPPHGRGPWYRDGVGTSLVVMGGLSAITGAVCYALARGAAGATFDPGTLDEYESHRARAGALQTASWITAAAGAALITGGVIRYATRPGPRGAELALRPTAGGLAMSLGGRF